MKIFAISDLHLSFQCDGSGGSTQDLAENNGCGDVDGSAVCSASGVFLGSVNCSGVDSVLDCSNNKVCGGALSSGKSGVDGGIAGIARHKPMDIFGENWSGYEERIMDNWNESVGEGDVGIIAGDISWAMRMAETKKDFEYLGRLKGTKIIVRGNHDYWWSTVTKVRESLPRGVHALQNDSLKIGNVVFCGTRGWKVPERYQKQSGEDKKIFAREVLRFEMSLKDAVAKMAGEGGRSGSDAKEASLKVAGAQKKLIAILHYPPFNSMRDDSPFTALCEKYGVAACVYGHLHGRQARTEKYTTKNGVRYFLTSCDQVDFNVVEIELSKS